MQLLCAGISMNSYSVDALKQYIVLCFIISVFKERKRYIISLLQFYSQR
jgi:hypothetical protein